MKKFYTLLAAAAVVLSASAAPINLNVEKAKTIQSKDLTLKKAMKSSVSDAQITPKSVNTKTRKMLSIRKADGQPSIEGTWTFTLGDYYFQTSLGEIQVDYEATISQGYLLFRDPSGYELPMAAIYDEAKSTVEFITANLGPLDSYYVIQQPYVYDWTVLVPGEAGEEDSYGDIVNKQSIVATYNASAGTLTFPITETEDPGISWLGALDENATQIAGYFNIYDLVSASKSAGTSGGGSTDGTWKEVGKATFMDGWVLPLFGIDQTLEENQYEVTVEQNLKNKYLVRLVNPYQSGPISQYNESTTGGYITFDLTDADHVLVNPGKEAAGFAYSQAQVSKLYCYNLLQFFINDSGFSASDVIEIMGDDMPYTTYKDNVITLGYIEGEEEDGTPYVDYDANFGVPGATEGGYVWKDKEGNPADMSAKVILPELDFNPEPDVPGAVTGIDAENTGAARYFNLQGVEVQNADKGIYIVVKNGKAVKVIR